LADALGAPSAAMTAPHKRGIAHVITRFHDENARFAFKGTRAALKRAAVSYTEQALIEVPAAGIQRWAKKTVANSLCWARTGEARS